MNAHSYYLLAADVLLSLHVLFVAFVVLGLLAVFAGAALAWEWVRNPWFRILHLVAIVVVAAQAWLGLVCPLTSIEMAFRAKAGEAAYSGAFISHWLQQLLYVDAPAWVFTACYSAFAILVVMSCLWVRPRPFRK